ncbi:hypothetical protein ASG37_14555 [Sphingomonas sp. Leaf407]|uniref:hypothetical protein n=1 Tax=unclassified Sphingomonas TaxID=196159 RepID=UPI0006F1FF3C|nr:MULTISPECIES: hypothetical protein [unclassified Sphingomonas]KQN35561.1 hypothetical protein ASE97_13810 [Sphingomonas sp. Leaf42]KQT26428.1 hypothetical protein ASG37_14555 [Sphingomonas sp. Leaf407]
MRTIYRLVAAAMALATAGSAAASERSYRADANATRSVDLSLCTNRVYVKVKGDGDTDLDFTITDDRGNVVHRDFDSTDLTFVTLTPRIDGGCASYALKVQNRGSVYNNFVVTIEDRGTTASTTTTAANTGQNRRIAIHNHTAEAFRKLYWSNTAETTFPTTNRLGTSPMNAGSNRNFDVNDGSGACHFDFKVETASGRSYTKSDINVCTESSIEFGTEFSH